MAQALFSALFESILYGVGWLVTKPADAIASRLVTPAHPVLRIAVDVLCCVLLYALILAAAVAVFMALFWLR